MKSRKGKNRRQKQHRQAAPVEREAPSAGELHTVAVWDLPTRLVHSALVLLLCLQILSGQFGLLPDIWHLWVGYALLVAVLFRLGWGLVGSESARFGPMLASLRGLPAYLPRLLSRQPTLWPGHNPVGALSSLLLIALLLGSAVSGLFIETWADYRGPLAERVGRSTSIWFNDFHSVIRWPLYVLVSIHILAALSYWLFKGEDRVRPIFRSGRLVLAEPASFSFASSGRAILVLIVSLAVVAGIVLFGPAA